MTALFELSGDHFDQGYMNLRARQNRTEQEIADMPEAMWRRYEPYADPDFADQFAQDPEARFWEMYLGCALLDAGKTLVPTADRPDAGGRPDICVVDGERRIWIEAIAPGVGDSPADGIPQIVPINQGGSLQAQPVRQIHLRITSALLTKRNAWQDTGSKGSSAMRILAWLLSVRRGLVFMRQDRDSRLPCPPSSR